MSYDTLIAVKNGSNLQIYNKTLTSLLATISFTFTVNDYVYDQINRKLWFFCSDGKIRRYVVTINSNGTLSIALQATITVNYDSSRMTGKTLTLDPNTGHVYYLHKNSTNNIIYLINANQADGSSVTTGGININYPNSNSTNLGGCITFRDDKHINFRQVHLVNGYVYRESRVYKWFAWDVDYSIYCDYYDFYRNSYQLLSPQHVYLDTSLTTINNYISTTVSQQQFIPQIDNNLTNYFSTTSYAIPSNRNNCYIINDQGWNLKWFYVNGTDVRLMAYGDEQYISGKIRKIYKIDNPTPPYNVFEGNNNQVVICTGNKIIVLDNFTFETLKIIQLPNTHTFIEFNKNTNEFYRINSDGLFYLDYDGNIINSISSTTITDLFLLKGYDVDIAKTKNKVVFVDKTNEQATIIFKPSVSDILYFQQFRVCFDRNQTKIANLHYTSTDFEIIVDSWQEENNYYDSNIIFYYSEDWDPQSNDPESGTWLELGNQKPASIIDSIVPDNGLLSNFNGYVKFTLSEQKKLTGINRGTNWYCRIQSIIY